MYPPLAAQAAELGIVVASQPGFLSSLGDGFLAAFPETGDELYAFASWQRAGITVAGSSDAPVVTADPRIGIRDAILRLGANWKRAKHWITSPDPAYVRKKIVATD